VTWQGTCNSTPVVSHDAAIAKFQTEVRNASDRTTHCTVHTELFDPTGKFVHGGGAQCTLAAGEVGQLESLVGPIDKPLLWHPRHPHLYRVHTRVYDGGEVVD